MNNIKKIGIATLLGAAIALASTLVNAQDGVRYLGPAISPDATSNPTATFQLTSDHCTPVTGGDGGGGCGLNDKSQSVFGTIVVTDLGDGKLDFKVTLLNGNTFVNNTFPLTFAFNLAGNPTIPYTNLTTGWQVPTGSPQSAGAFNQDGTGYFEYGVLWGMQGDDQGSADPLHFDINATGLTLASLEKNAAGHYFAVDIMSGTTGATGNVDASSIFSCTNCGDIPEPASLALLAIGMFALYAFGRRRRR